jgi:glycosyltransferase involved in cell wall biosynthesis/LmbE family N-acetylglucosaminyl deacetylase
MEQSLIPYHAVKSLSATRVLVIAPHPDDEVFGCGGTIAAFVEYLIPVHVVVLTDGDAAKNSDGSLDYAQERRAESLGAAALLGYGVPEFWSLPDRSLGYDENLIYRCSSLIEDIKADLVLCPSLYEIHPDHYAVAQVAIEAARRTSIRVAFYEVGQPMMRPNRLVDISRFSDLKRKAIGCFNTQLNIQNYGEQIFALNTYRTYTLDEKVCLVEAFYEADPSDASTLLDSYRYQAFRADISAIRDYSPDLPLVSVLVRTTLRETLDQALGSIAQQTYPRIEVVLVNAKPILDGNQNFSADLMCGKFPLKVIQTSQNLDRPAAAQLALENARGRLAIFLDEDDWFDPVHIMRLAHAWVAGVRLPAVYSGVARVDKNGSLLPETFDRPFSRPRLLLENYIPIHAVLFDLDNVRKHGYRFDHKLAVYEDWDFWLQISQTADFLHIPGCTAYYRLGSADNSNVHESDRVHASLTFFYSKWAQSWPADQIARGLDDIRSDWKARVNALESKVTMHTAVAGQVSAEATRRASEITALQGQIQAMLRSRSWRLTQPIRWVGRKTRALRVVSRFITRLMHQPWQIPLAITQLMQTARELGYAGVKNYVRHIAIEIPLDRVWAQYKRTYSRQIRSKTLEMLERLDRRPCISILMPCYNSIPSTLTRAVQSVKDQIYQNWELCLIDDGSSDPVSRNFIAEIAKTDNRISLIVLPLNSGIAAASNAGLSASTGEYVALMDHDDILEPQALARMAEAFVMDNADFVYSDEALFKGDESEIITFAFRPMFSLELLRSHPYIVHMVGFKRSLLDKISGFDASLAISQDYDLILRAAEQALCIVHIPEVLYLWRQDDSSAGHRHKNLVTEVSLDLLHRHLERTGENAEVFPSKEFNFYDVRYRRVPGQRVAIIIPTKNGVNLVKQCINSIRKTCEKEFYDIILIDHESTDAESKAYFKHLQKTCTVLPYQGPFNFSTINNWAVAQLDTSRYEYYLFCNNDIEALHEGWLGRMIELAQKPDIGIVGAKLLYPDQTTYQHAGVCVGMYGAAEHYGKFMSKWLPSGREHPGVIGSFIANRELSAVTAACLLIRREVFSSIGGFDEQLAVGFGDVDLCLRARNKGYRVVFCPHAELIHHESVTRGKHTSDPHPQDTLLFRTRYAREIESGDPYFNPNFSYNDTRWTVCIPMAFSINRARRVFRPSRPLQVAAGKRLAQESPHVDLTE